MGYMPGRAMANQNGQSGLVSRGLATTPNRLTTTSAIASLLPLIARIEPVHQTTAFARLICTCKDPLTYGIRAVPTLFDVSGKALLAHNPLQGG
jgi:hypothetical protein